MTDANAGTPSPAATSSGGGSNNGQRNSNNNNNNRNNNNDNRNKQVSDTAIINDIGANKKIYHLPNSSHKGSTINADFQYINKCLARAVSQLGLKSSGHFAESIQNMVEVLPTEPTKPKKTPPKSGATDDEKEEATETYKAEMAQWSAAKTDHNRELAQLKKDRQVVFLLVEGLMSDDVKLKVEGDKDHPNVGNDPIGLLKIIRKVCCGYSNVEGNVYHNNVTGQLMLMTGFQKKNERVDDYLRRTTGNLKAFEDSGGCMHMQPSLIEQEAIALYENKLPTNASTNRKEIILQIQGLSVDETKNVLNTVKAKHQAAFLFNNLNNDQFKGLKADVLNSELLGTPDAYPDSKTSLVDLVTRYRSTASSSSSDRRGGPGRGGGGTGGGGGAGRGGGNDGLQFAQVSESSTAAADADDAPTITTPPTTTNNTNLPTTVGCIHCGKEDHAATECPELTPERRAQLLAQNKASATNLGTVLDTCSEFTAAPKEALTNIREAPVPLKFSTSTGPGIHTQIGDFAPFNDGSVITAWVNPSSEPSTINATILALQDVIKDHRVTYDSQANGGAFLVHTSAGVYHLKPCPITSFPRLDSSSSPSQVQLIQAQPDDVQGAVSEQVEEAVPDQVPGATVPTIRANLDDFTAHEIKRATHARNTQTMTNQSEKKFRHLVSNRLLHNCDDITTRDITNAHKMFGRDLPGLRGGTKRRRPKRVEVNLVEIPRDFMNLHKNITLTADVFFVNGIPFLLTLSRQVRFITVQHVPHRSAGELANSIKLTLQKYGAAGFLVPIVLMDGEFDKVCDKLPNTVVNTTAAREHVMEIERMIQTVKVKVRGIKNTLPWRLRHKPLPNLFIKSMVYNAVFWLNAFPASPGVGISTVFSPRELVLRQSVDIKATCKVLFGSYCEVHHEPESKDTNTMQPRTSEGIAMGPVGNIQGTQKFYDLRTRRIIKRNNFDILPMSDSIMDLIIQHGEHDKQGNKLNVRNRQNQPFEWDLEDDDDDDMPLVEDNAPEPTVDAAPFPAEVPGIPTTSNTPVNHPDVPLPAIEERIDVNNNDDAAAADDDLEARAIAARENADFQENINLGFMPDIVEEEEEGAEQDIVEDEGAVEGAVDEGAPIIPVGDDNADIRHVNNVNAGAIVVEDVDESEEEDFEVDGQRMAAEDIQQESDAGDDDENEDDERDEEEPVRRSQRSRQPLRRPSEEGYQIAQQVTVDDETIEPIELKEDEMELFVKLMKQTQDKSAIQDMQFDLRQKVQAMQVSLKRGIKLWGDKAKESAHKEMKQMDNYNVMIPKYKHELTREERRRALATLIFLKEKRDGSIKSRTCVNGAPQREYIPKEDASSPTVMTDAVILTACIDAWQLRDVATVDLPGAFLHTVTDEKVIVTLRGVLCDLMVQVDPEAYRKYVSIDHKGQPILYMQLYKSCYGLLRSSLLFYRKLRKELEDYGLEINPYDPCVFNKTVEGSQLTATLHATC